MDQAAPDGWRRLVIEAGENGGAVSRRVSFADSLRTCLHNACAKESVRGAATCDETRRYPASSFPVRKQLAITVVIGALFAGCGNDGSARPTDGAPGADIGKTYREAFRFIGATSSEVRCAVQRMRIELAAIMGEGAISSGAPATETDEGTALQRAASHCGIRDPATTRLSRSCRNLDLDDLAQGVARGGCRPSG